MIINSFRRAKSKERTEVKKFLEGEVAIKKDKNTTLEVTEIGKINGGNRPRC